MANAVRNVSIVVTYMLMTVRSVIVTKTLASLVTEFQLFGSREKNT